MQTPLKHALSLLTRREHSRQELKQKLLQKGHQAEEINTALDHLESKKFLDDTRFTELYIRSKCSKGQGPERIRLALKQLGIHETIIAEQLAIADNDWRKLAAACWQKHFKGKHPTNYAEKAKQMRHLQYRGFTQEHIRHLFDDEET